MSNAHVSPDVLSNLMLLQQGKRYELQQQILHTSSESVVQRFSVKKMLLKLLQNSQKWDSNTGVFLLILQKFLRTIILKNIC